MILLKLLKSIFVVIFFFNISKILTEDNPDPDVSLCEDLTVDAAVSADDGNDYIFKGDYSWKLDTNTGIVDEYAVLTNERWPFLPTPFDTGFVLDEGQQRGKSTVFIKGNEWYKYKGKERMESGFTTQWNRFPKGIRIQGAFNLINVTSYSTPIFFIYKDDDYSKYIITDINEPQIIQIGKTWRIGRFLYFLEGYYAGTQSFQLFSDMLIVRGVVANKQHLVFFGERQFCVANSTVVSPSCEVYSSSVYFKCQRSPKPDRIKTTTVSTTTKTVSTIVTTIQTQITTEQKPSLDSGVEDKQIKSNAIKINAYYLYGVSDGLIPIAFSYVINVLIILLFDIFLVNIFDLF